MYTSVAPSKVIKAGFVHSRGSLSGNLSAKLPELTTSWCWISLTMGTNAFVDLGGFLLRAARKWSCSSLPTPAVHYTINWWLRNTISIYSHPTACCCVSLPLPVLRTMFKWASWVIYPVAALAASQWTCWWLRCCCVPISDVFDVSPTNWSDFDPLTASRGGCGSMICWCGIGEEDDNEKKWEVLRTIWLASCQNRISSSQHVPYTQDESCCVWPHIAGVSHCPAMCDK